MKKYVKFTEGECVYLTPHKAYELLSSGGKRPFRDLCEIINDTHSRCIIRSPENKKKCPHINARWQWCDENGKEITT